MRNPTRTIKWGLLAIGLIALLISIFFVAQILTFIGLGLTLWGILLFYVQPEEYAKKILLDETSDSSKTTLRKVISELGYKGEAIYLPPNYMNDPEENILFISKEKNEQLPKPENMLKQKNALFLEKPKGILLTPPGAQLAKLFEKTLETKFTKENLQYITEKIPRLLIIDLEIAANVEIKIENNEIKFIITNSIFKETSNYDDSSHAINSVGGPLSSALACALAKTTGKPIVIKTISTTQKNKETEITYQILGEVLTEIPPKTLENEEQTNRDLKKIGQMPLRKPSSPELVSIFLSVIGLVLLIQVAWITFNDIVIWGKDLFTILLGSRTGEAMSLGIGITLIYYLLIGSALLLSGLFIFLRREENLLLIGDLGKSFLTKLMSNPASSLLTILGLMILFWVGWLIYYDAIFWGKDLFTILLGSRTGEAMSLGIGITLVYYLLIGSGLVLSGLFIFLRRRSLI